jgi:hypothetical protein
VKVEEGICDGEIMFHEFIEKSEKEIKQIKNIREKKRYVSDTLCDKVCPWNFFGYSSFHHQ